MFDLPDAKRVRRSDLYNRSGSQSPSPAPFEADPELERHIHSRLAALYGPVSIAAPVAATISASSNANANPNPDQDSNIERKADPEPEADQDQEQEFEFRLFSAPQNASSTSTATQKIILTDDHPSQETGGLIHPSRPKEYYISLPSTGEAKARYNLSAIDGSTVLQWSKKRAWGLEVPWRVRVLRVSKSEALKLKNGEKNGGISGGDQDQNVVEGVGIELMDVDTKKEGEGKKKSKPNKKRRIILREKKKKRQGIEEQKRKEKEAKEEAERQKRTRRNREKKVKRKMKEKAKKPEGGGVVDGGGMDVDGSGSE